MWNSMSVQVHNHSRIKSFLQSIYLKRSVHKLWIWQRIFPLHLGLISFLETTITILLTCGRVLYLCSVLVLRPVTNTRLLTFVTTQAESLHTLLCLLVLPSQYNTLLACSGVACSAGFPSVGIQVWSWKRGFELHVAPGTTAVTATVSQSLLKMMVLASTLLFPHCKDQSCAGCLYKDKSCSSWQEFWIQQRPGGCLLPESPASPLPFPIHKSSLLKNTCCYFVKKIQHTKI